MYEVYKLHFYSRDLVQISLRQLIAVEVTTELPTRMATLFGHVGEFNNNKREWIQYVEQLDHFYEANGITENNWNNCYNRSRDLQDTKECCNAQKTRRDVIPRFSGGYKDIPSLNTIGDCAAISSLIADLDIPESQHPCLYRNFVV